MGKWKGRTPEQKAARKLRHQEYMRRYSQRTYNGLRPHGRGGDHQPRVDPQLLREASDLYARRCWQAEVTGDPPPKRNAWDKMTPEQREKFT